MSLGEESRQRSGPRQIVVEYARGAPRGWALDLGCGAGDESIYLAEQLGFEKVVAVDNESRKCAPPGEGLERLEAIARERGLPIEVRREDFRAFPMGTECFAVILALYSLHYDADAFPEMCRRITTALIPGGRLILGLRTRTVRIYETTTEAQVRDAPPQFPYHTVAHVRELFPSFVGQERDDVAWDRQGHPGADYPHAHTFLEFFLDKPNA